MKKSFILLIMLTGTILLQAQVRRTPVQRTQTQQSSTAQTATRAFTLTNGKLGPIQVGQRFANIPATYAGLYDKYTRQIEKEYNEVEDFDMTFVCYQFTKEGQNIFKVVMEGNRISAIRLQEGSTSIVKTQEGFYVGYPVRTFFTKKPLEWFNLEGGTATAFDTHYTYEVKAADRQNLSSVQSVNDFKPTAKISEIIYHD